MKNKLNDIYNQIRSEYSNNGTINKEKLEKDVELISKQINGMKNSATKANSEEKQKAILEQIKKLELRKQNLEGYSKYNSQIDKIRNYKTSLSNKISRMEKEKTVCDKQITSLEKQLTVQNKKMDDLNKKNDPSKTVELTNAEYDDLQEKIKQTKELIEKIKKELNEQKTKKELYEKKVTELKGKVGKCDLAWKTLFTNKDWAEIQRRSLGENKSYTKKKEQNVEKEDIEHEKEDVGEENKENEIITSENNNSKSLVPTQKISLFKKFTNFMKKTVNNVKNFFTADVEDEKEVIEENEDEIRTKKIEEIKAKKTKEETEKVEEVQKETPKTIKKDNFLEGLRFNVDQEYRENITRNKEQAYIEKHKIKKDVADKEIGD